MTVVGGGRENLNGRQSMRGLGLSNKWRQPDSSIPLASWACHQLKSPISCVKTPKPPFGETRLTRQSDRHKQDSAIAIRLALPTICRSSRQTQLQAVQESPHMATMFLLGAPRHNALSWRRKFEHGAEVCSICGNTYGHDVRAGLRPDEYVLICLTIRNPRSPRRTTRSPAGLGSNKYSFTAFATTMASAYPTSDMWGSHRIVRCLASLADASPVSTILIGLPRSLLLSKVRITS